MQEVLLSFLWNRDVNTVLIALSCIGLLCEAVDIVQSSESLNEFHTFPNFSVYAEMSLEARKFTAGEYFQL